MTELNEPQLLADWLDVHPGEPPPEGIDPEVIQAVYALRPDLAPAARVTVDDILDGVTTGPFAQNVPPETRQDESNVRESDLDEVNPIVDTDQDAETTPVLGGTGTDPIIEGLVEDTDPELLPIEEDLEEEPTNPSLSGPGFGVVNAPPPPDESSSVLWAPLVSAPSRPSGPLSSAGLPTSPVAVEPEESPVDPSEAAEEPLLVQEPDDPQPEKIVVLADQPRWRSRRLWTLSGTVAAAAIVLVVVGPSRISQALSPGFEATSSPREAMESSPREAMEPTTKASEDLEEGLQLRLDSSTRATPDAAGPSGLDEEDQAPERRKKSKKREMGSITAMKTLSARQADADDAFLEEMEEEEMEREPSSPTAANKEGPREDDLATEPAQGLASGQVTQEASPDDPDDRPMSIAAAASPAPAPYPSGAGNLDEEDVAFERSVQSSRARGFSRSNKKIKSSETNAEPPAPPPQEMEALRREAKPTDYRSDWYLMGARLSDATLENIRQVLQEADADTRANDYARAALVVSRMIGDKDPRVAQDFAGRAAAWTLVEVGDPAAAMELIAQGKASSSANTPFLARLHYLEGMALEKLGKPGRAAESYRTAQNLNKAR